MPFLKNIESEIRKGTEGMQERVDSTFWFGGHLAEEEDFSRSTYCNDFEKSE